MTLPLCHKPCTCVCRQNHITWLESETSRLSIALKDKQGIIERLMESVPTRRPEAWAAKIAYLTTPDVGRYMLNIQAFGSDDLIRIEIAPEQMRNILSDGVSLMLRQSFHPVPIKSTEVVEP